MRLFCYRGKRQSWSPTVTSTAMVVRVVVVVVRVVVVVWVLVVVCVVECVGDGEIEKMSKSGAVR